jgi:hypothetical protein
MKLGGDLSIPRPSVQAGGELEYAVTNTGDVPIMLGASYSLERREGLAWSPVDHPRMFPSWGRSLRPGGHTTLSLIAPTHLTPGHYRLLKQLDADRDPRPGFEWVAQHDFEPVQTKAEFDVIPS